MGSAFSRAASRRSQLPEPQFDDAPESAAAELSYDRVLDRAPGPGAPLRRVLLVEDSDADAILVRRQLEATSPGEFSVTRVADLAMACDHLNSFAVDCVLLDLSLPDSFGLDSLGSVRAAAPEVPIVVLTGLDDEAAAVATLSHGAQDYLTKGEADGRQLWRAMRYAAERQRADLALRFHALHDPLTGLPNRTLFVERLELALLRLKRADTKVAVLFIDLDRFKWVNDSLGHDAGDELIMEVARRLHHALRPTDMAARLGGDEFLVVCEDMAADHNAVAIADRLQASLAVPFVLRGIEVRISASVGIAVADAPGLAASDLLRDADAAMYRAKAKGKARSEIFDVELREAARQRLELENDLHRAVDDRAFSVRYQPIVDLDDGHVCGAEALVRWEHPTTGVRTPAEFVAVAEETGAILRVGEQVLRQVCPHAHAWTMTGAVTGVPNLDVVTVNLSAREIADDDLLARIGGAIDAWSIDPARLCFEITETSIIDDKDASLRRIHAIKALGVRLAIDDFGVGYSSLTYLKLFPFDIVKIDRSFIAGIGGEVSDPSDEAIIASVVGLAKSLGMTVVAEGVESAHQAHRLRELGCRLAQGYYFSPPVEAHAFDRRAVYDVSHCA